MYVLHESQRVGQEDEKQGLPPPGGGARILGLALCFSAQRLFVVFF